MIAALIAVVFVLVALAGMVAVWVTMGPDDEGDMVETAKRNRAALDNQRELQGALKPEDYEFFAASFRLAGMTPPQWTRHITPAEQKHLDMIRHGVVTPPPARGWLSDDAPRYSWQGSSLIASERVGQHQINYKHTSACRCYTCVSTGRAEILRQIRENS